MSIELVLDNREKKLIKCLETTHKITVEMLDLGDIIFRKGEEIILIIERKTVKDLKASITDGRAREQKARLLNSGIPVNKIIYLIEGSLDYNLDVKIQGVPVSTLLGSLINTQLRDGINVYKTVSLKETANFLRKLLDKLEKDGTQYFKQNECITASGYAKTLKKKKKANMTPEVWFISQLALVPQVTEKVAEEIVKIYPNVCELVKKYEETDEKNRPKLLSDIRITLSTGKQRRLGNKISERIHRFFYGVNAPS